MTTVMINKKKAFNDDCDDDDDDDDSDSDQNGDVRKVGRTVLPYVTERYTWCRLAFGFLDTGRYRYWIEKIQNRF